MYEKIETYDACDYLLKMYKKIPKNFKLCFISTFIIGLVAHAYCYFVPIFGHDATAISHEASIIEGAAGARWFQSVMFKILGDCTLPWIIGLLSLFFYSITAWAVCEILQIERTVSIIAISGILVTSPNAIICNYYISGAYALAFALMTCVLSVYAFYRMKHGVVWAITFLLLGAGTYVSYVDVAMSVFLLMQIGLILQKKGENISKVIKKHFQMLGIFAVGYIGTYLINWAIYTVAGQTPQGRVSDAFAIVTGSESQGGFKALGIKILKAMWHSVAAVLPLRNWSYFQQRRIYYTIFVIALILSIIVCMYIILKQKLWKKRLTFILLVFDGICLLLAISFIDVFQIPHPLMTAAYVIPWLFMIQLYEIVFRIQPEKVNNKIKFFIYSSVIVLNSIITIVEGCLLANTCYMRAYNNYMSSVLTMNRVVDRVECIEEYRPGNTPVIILGRFLGNTRGYFSWLSAYEVTYDLMWYNSGLTTAESIEEYISQHLRVDMNIVYINNSPSEEDLLSISTQISEKGYWLDEELFEEMIEADYYYPSVDSVKRCGDVIVVILPIL